MKLANQLFSVILKLERVWFMCACTLCIFICDNGFVFQITPKGLVASMVYKRTDKTRYMYL